MSQANLTIYQKGAYYLGIKIFNNLPLEIENVAGNQKTKKKCTKKICRHLTNVTQQKSALVNRELRIVSQDCITVVP
jgi:hypothetical protein